MCQASEAVCGWLRLNDGSWWSIEKIKNPYDCRGSKGLGWATEPEPYLYRSRAFQGHKLDQITVVNEAL
ncbi:hypothetical protein SynPROS71_00423 [Synechococcus sp. PROS-7-1]|nr:hypothetical protein SynPROS71_00423 [Synechococcus sp. PROS-7-1]